MNKMNSRKNVRGQGMSEYLIIVALIAVAGIAVMGLFGGAARNQVAGLAAEISGGDATSSIGASADNASNAFAAAEENTNLNNYADQKSRITKN